MVNRVVAAVLIPRVLSLRHAWSPSHVAGTLTQSREMSKFGSRAWQKCAKPMVLLFFNVLYSFQGYTESQDLREAFSTVFEVLLEYRGFVITKT